MIPVGIHENFAIDKVSKNDQGTLEIDGSIKATGDALDVFNSTSDSSSSTEQKNNFKIFNPLQAVKFGETQTYEQISKQITEFKDKLSHIVLQFKTSDSLRWDVTRGLGITNSNIKTKLLDDNILAKVYNNIVDDFIKNMVGADLTKLFRVKLTRQSKAKYFPKFPDSKFGFSGKNAFLEPMSVPADQSQIAFSDYEDKQGYSNPEPVAAVADKPTDGELAEQKELVEETFGK